MRRALLAVVVALAGCPSSQNPGDGDDAPPGDGGMGDDGGPTCEAVPTCTVTIKYAGAGGSVSLRGDFAPDGWTTGVEMPRNANGDFEVTLPVHDQQVVVYKLVVDGSDDRIVGIHMIGPDAPEILQAAAVAVKARLKKSDFDATIALHPTMSEELVLMR